MSSVNGYAFAGPEILDEHKAAFEQVKHIQGAVLSDVSTYARRTKRMDPEKTKGLTDLQKLVLADGGPSPFGGHVDGNTVAVYTD
ncbi:hypothetical protein [Arthrobacter cryoconiti]|uniref:Uncharacterized protein n=1 Tax=Arthrobacter cryoconiti TaxID=748907 RepID=A0ABV8QWK6_9MICC|nr:hypothetical protein [Arthrobacter cryoconiti]MCC9068839.1 hypothetical protein [Arthrobacter cryoconiti]